MPAVPTTTQVVGAVQPTGMQVPADPKQTRASIQVEVVAILAIAIFVLISLLLWLNLGCCGLKAKYSNWRAERNRPRTPAHLTGADRDFWRQHGFVSSLPRPQVDPRIYVERNLADSRCQAAAKPVEQSFP
jgi:hypothetical protein